jgi:hypothetical protein
MNKLYQADNHLLSYLAEKLKFSLEKLPERKEKVIKSRILKSSCQDYWPLFAWIKCKHSIGI